jgi:ATP-dependent Clp protease ATP-binding subunit ClpX
MSDTELLATLPLILRSAQQNAEFANEWVELIRGRKISWAEIGKALGVSRQAAWERFASRQGDAAAQKRA